MIHAAGIIFLTKEDEVLLLLRSSDGDHPKQWCFPGGKVEDGESAEQAAVRETIEEVGQCPDGERLKLLTTVRPVEQTSVDQTSVNQTPDAPPTQPEEVEFTSFVQFVDEPFDVELSDEHLTHMWCNADDLPLGMHPGAEIALRRLRGNELDIARMMSVGDIPSPQRYGGMWLFDMRITGTGVSYREDREEYVYRPPDEYLTPNFVDRCAGLPIIIEHPKGKLDSEEYRERNVGSMFIPYIHGNEVRGVAKIFDDVAARLMIEKKLSTSPAVYFRANTNTTLELEGGGTVLIEGKPSILEHLAICPLGVWDKGGPPSGLTRRKLMNDEEKKALFGALDSMSKRLDSVTGRLDSIEAKEGDKKKGDDVVDNPDKSAMSKDRKDSEDGKTEKDKKESEASEKEAAADRKEEAERKDSDDDKKEDKDKERKDSDDKGDKDGEGGKMKVDAKDAARKDSDREEDRKDAARREAELDRKYNERFASIERLVSGNDAKLYAQAQLKTDSVAMLFGDSAQPPMVGETLHSYRVRMAKPFQKHSKAWEKVDLSKITDAALFDIAEDQIYKDSIAMAHSPQHVAGGELREIKHRDRVGREISKFIGEPRSWMGQFMGEASLVHRINKTQEA